MECELKDCANNFEGMCSESDVKLCKVEMVGRVPAGWCVCDNYEKGD